MPQCIELLRVLCHVQLGKSEEEQERQGCWVDGVRKDRNGRPEPGIPLPLVDGKTKTRQGGEQEQILQNLTLIRLIEKITEMWFSHY